MQKFYPIKQSPTALLLSLPAAAGAEEASYLSKMAGNLSYLQADAVIILLLGSTVLLLTGVLLRMRQLRIRLQAKTQSLEKSERHIRLLGDNLPNVTIFQLVRTAEGSFRFTYLSKGYDELLGLDREQVLSDARQAYDHVYEEDLPLLQQALKQSASDLTPAELELRILNHDGELQWLRLSAVPHWSENLLIWDGFIQDISINKRAEDALLEENRNFQNLFQTIDDFMLVCDMDGRLHHTNPAVNNRLLYSEDELKNMSIFELFAEEAKDDIFRVMAAMQSQLSASAALSLRSKSGGLIPVEMNVFQGFWKNKRAVFGVARDVAGRKQTENALRESQQMLQLIMDTIPMSVFWKDKDSIYLGCNKTFIRECGFERYDQVVGKNPYDLFPAEMAGGVIERDQDVINSNQPFFHFTQSHTRPDGSIGWREISKIPLRDEEGSAVGVLGVWRDVTEQNRAEERLKRTLEDMERFNQLMRGRERRTLELKSEINSLLKQLELPKKYRTTTDDF